MRALLWPLFTRSEWAKTATVLAGRTGEGASLPSALSIGVGSGSHCVGGTTCECAPSASVRFFDVAQLATVVTGKTGENDDLASVRFEGVGSAATAMKGTTGDGAALASDRLFRVGSASNCGGGQDRLRRCSDHCSLGRSGYSLTLCWRERQ
jgi:hypothetical protein